ncbi:MAG: ABC-type transport auxiliary lipoprotein family protein [Thermoanaerobaculia bacterium]|nr:ABC-type transport auxiliary lipoprotein family protein [Thermoanaerobaculia bacterium]
MTASIRIALVALIVAAGCAKQRPTHYYLLEAAVPAADSRSGDGLAVGVRPTVVEPPYDEAGIVYRIGEGSREVGFYAYHEWAAPLSRMLPRLIADTLAGTAGIASIHPAAAGRTYDARLDSRLVALEEIDVGDEQRVRLRMGLRLVAGDEVIWRRAVESEGTVRTDRVEAVVALMNDVLVAAIRDLRPGLEEALAGR